MADDWKDRVRQERAELADKLVKLTAFLSNGSADALPEEDKNLLRDQRDAMECYWEALDARIARF